MEVSIEASPNRLVVSEPGRENIPTCGFVLQKLAVFILRVLGWRLAGSLPNVKKAVIIGYPHTSNWDGILLIIMSWALGMRSSWLLKESALNVPVLGWLLRKVGAIGVNRSGKQNSVEQITNLFNETDKLFLIVAPEGTRSWAPGWRSGFYHIAQRANIPVLCGFLDYQRKVGGVGPCIQPSGNTTQDMNILRDFLKDKVGKYPDSQSPIILQDQSATSSVRSSPSSPSSSAKL